MGPGHAGMPGAMGRGMPPYMPRHFNAPGGMGTAQDMLEEFGGLNCLGHPGAGSQGAGAGFLGDALMSYNKRSFSFSDLGVLEAPLHLATDEHVAGEGLPRLDGLPRNFSLSDMGPLENL